MSKVLAAPEGEERSLDMSYTAPLSTLEIHLDAVARNYLFLQRKMKLGTDCAAVVKADAYGLGATDVSQALFTQNCRHFFVATFEEGAIVRKALLPQGAAAIYVLHGPNGAAPEDFVAEALIPVLNTLPDVEYWARFSSKSGQKQQAVLHLDTGMNRLGMTAKEVADLNSDKDLLRSLNIRYIMSHLACADDPLHPKNHIQLQLFEEMTATMGVAARYSLANSGGILLGEDYHFDLARPGCGLYGINPHPASPNPMQGAITFKCRILQVNDIDHEGTVGYGASYKISPPARYATLSLGYADGYFRSFDNHGTVVIGQEKCKVVGRISMNCIVVDVTALKIPPHPGDWAEIIGPHQTADDLAKQAGTIGYEILTTLGKGHKRIYTGA
jgi:alanine racemase